MYIVRNIFIDNRCKSINEEIFINIDKINNSIKDKKKIIFNYYDYNCNKELVPILNKEKDFKLYKVNLVYIILKNENYYLILFEDKHDDLSNYRIYRMKNIKIIDEDMKRLNHIEECRDGFTEDNRVLMEDSFRTVGGIIDLLENHVEERNKLIMTINDLKKNTL